MSVAGTEDLEGSQEGTEEPAPETVDAEVSAEDVAPRLSRRQRVEKEKSEHAAALKSANDRAEEAVRISKEISENFGRFREENARQLNEQFQRFQPREQRREEPQQQWAPPDTRDIQKKMKAALASSDVDAYLELTESLADAKAQTRMAEVMARFPQQQPQFQRPNFISVIENQFPDVVLNPRGAQVVTGYVAAYRAQGMNDQQALTEAFKTTRQLLGTGGQSQQPKDNSVTVDRQAMMGNSKSAGMSGGSGARTNPSGKIKVKGLPSNYVEIAKAAKMSPQRYVQHWIASNPDSVEK